MIIIDAKHPAPDARLRPIHGDRWGDWVFDEKNLTLHHLVDDRWNWEVDLERFHTSAAMLDSVFQAATHGYDITALVDALNDLLDPQANVCPWSVGRQFNPTTWLKRPRQTKDVSKAEFDAAWKKFRDAQRSETATGQTEAA